MLAGIHPDIQRTMDAVKLTTVQDAIRRLGEHDLGVGIPYMRDKDGTITSIPKDMVIFEDQLQLCYLQSEDPAAQGGPVGWRWDVSSSEPKLNSSCGHWKCGVRTHCGPVPTSIQRAKEAIGLSKVQEILRTLDKYGLGVILPHMHDQDGFMTPLPKRMISLEDSLQVEFRSADDPEIHAGEATGWRWDPDSEQTAVIAATRLSRT